MGMKSLLRNVTAPLLSLALLMLGTGFLMTYISVRLDFEGFDATVIGYVHSAYYAGFLIGALKIESLIKRVKHIRSFAIFASFATSLIAIQGMWLNPFFWIGIRFASGLCVASLYVVIESWLLTVTPQSNRGTILSFYMISLYSAQAASQFLLEMISLSSLEAFLITAFLCSLSIIPVAFTNAKTPTISENSSFRIFRVMKTAPFGFFGCMFSGMILSSIYSFAPTYAQDTFVSISLLMSLTIAGGFLLQWPIGYLSDIFDRRKILVLVSFATLLPCIGIIFTGSVAMSVFVLSFVLGGVTFTLYPLSITQVCDRFHADDITNVTGILLLAYSIGSIVGPLTAPFFIDNIYPFGLYVFIGFVALLLGLLGLFAIWKSAPVPKEEQGEFIPLPRETPVVYELDPRKDN